MKKIFKLFGAFIVLALICLLQPVKAQLSNTERLERCQNNENRLAELEVQLQVVDADLSASMGERELENARTQMIYLKSLRLEKAQFDRTRFDRIAADYNFKFQECFYAGKEASEDDPFNNCVAKLEKIIADKINRSLSLDRPALKAKKKEIEQQIAEHRTNLIALDCDNKANKTSGACKLEGSWTQDTPGIGTTTWEIKTDGTADERGIGYAKGKATLNGNVLHIDWKTSTGYSGYYEWTLDENCKSVKGELVFKTGRTDNLKSTVKKN